MKSFERAKHALDAQKAYDLQKKQNTAKRYEEFIRDNIGYFSNNPEGQEFTKKYKEAVRNFNQEYEKALSIHQPTEALNQKLVKLAELSKRAAEQKITYNTRIGESQQRITNSAASFYKHIGLLSTLEAKYAKILYKCIYRCATKHELALPRDNAKVLGEVDRYTDEARQTLGNKFGKLLEARCGEEKEHRHLSCVIASGSRSEVLGCK
jgi:hypothetical protein